MKELSAEIIRDFPIAVLKKSEEVNVLLGN